MWQNLRQKESVFKQQIFNSNKITVMDLKGHRSRMRKQVLLVQLSLFIWEKISSNIHLSTFCHAYVKNKLKKILKNKISMAYLVFKRTMNNIPIQKNSNYAGTTKNCSSLSHIVTPLYKEVNIKYCLLPYTFCVLNQDNFLSVQLQLNSSKIS